jgi:hypothetical protein
MVLETQKDKITAERLYMATTKEEISPGYTALENWGLRGWLARRLMEVERQTLRTQQAIDLGGEKLEEWKHKRLHFAIDQLQAMFRDKGQSMTAFAEYREFHYGFRVRLHGHKKLVRYRHRVRGVEWRSFPDNVPVVLAYTDAVLREALGRPTGTVSNGTTAE